MAKNEQTETDLGKLSSKLIKMTVEVALETEIEHHLSFERRAAENRNLVNRLREGRSSETLKGTHGEARIYARDGSGTFEPASRFGRGNFNK